MSDPATLCVVSFVLTAFTVAIVGSVVAIVVSYKQDRNA
jgi:hypothetical protein